MTSRSCTMLLLLLLMTPTPGWAQTPPPTTADATDLKTVQVQAARYDARRDDTATRIVVDAASLRQYGDPALLDALKRLPGVSVVPGAPGRAGVISLRGLGSGYTQILINGQKAPTGFDLDALTPEMVERVEILRAPTADLRGEAIAGTLNIVLVAGAKQDSDSTSLSWDTLNGRSTASASWQHSRQTEKKSYALTTRVSRRVFRVEETATENAYNRDGLHVVQRDSQLLARGSRDALTLTPSMDLTFGTADTLALQGLLDVSRFRRHTEIDWDTLEGPPLLHSAYQQQTAIDLVQFSASADWGRDLEDGGRLTARLSLGGNHEDYRYREQGQDPQGAQNLDDHTDAGIDVLNLDSTGSYAFPSWGRHTFKLGWNANQDARDEQRVQQLVPIAGLPGSVSDLSFDARVRRLAVYGQDELALTPRWSLYAGLRWERIDTLSTGSGFAPVRQQDSVLSPVLQSLWKLPGTQARQFRVALSRTYKAPTLASLIPRPYTSTNNRALNPDEQGNPALRPELATGVDISYESERKDGLQLSVGGYARRIRDVQLTETVLQDGRWVATPRNGGSARSWGLEMDAKLALDTLLQQAPAVTLRANATRNFSDVEDVPGPNNRLDGQLRFTGSVGADYRINPRWTTGVGYTWRSGDATRVSVWQTDREGWQRELDLYALWTVSARSKLRLSANNLLHPDRVSGQEREDAEGRQVLRRERRITSTWRLQWELSL